MIKSATSQNKVENFSSAWSYICGQLKGEYGESVFNNWLHHLEFLYLEGSEAVFAVPTRFIREWICNNYTKKILHLLQKENPSIKKVNILVRKKKITDASSVANSNSSLSQSNPSSNIKIAKINNEQSNIGSPLDPRFTFENFVVGGSNKLAYSAAKAIAENKEIAGANNPLFLHGGVGLGKTHLMHAIALHVEKEQPERRVVYLSAEKFMYQFIHALRNKEIMSFKDKFRNVDILMIDDIQFICGKEGTQEEFFHTINTLLDMKKQIVISGDRSPADLDGMKERVRSRLGWGLVADIGSSDFDLRLGVLKSKLNNMKNINVPAQVVEFLAGKVRSNIRELEGALNKVVAHSSLVGEKIDLNTTQSILRDLLNANDRNVTIGEIQKKVAKYFEIKISDMLSSKRSRSIARPRQIAMYICKNHTMRSLSEIGRKFGGKDHTTVIHAVKKIDELMLNDSEIKDDVDSLVRSLS